MINTLDAHDPRCIIVPPSNTIKHTCMLSLKISCYHIGMHSIFECTARTALAVESQLVPILQKACMQATRPNVMKEIKGRLKKKLELASNWGWPLIDLWTMVHVEPGWFVCSQADVQAITWFANHHKLTWFGRKFIQFVRMVHATTAEWCELRRHVPPDFTPPPLGKLSEFPWFMLSLRCNTQLLHCSHRSASQFSHIFHSHRLTLQPQESELVWQTEKFMGDHTNHYFPGLCPSLLLTSF